MSRAIPRVVARLLVAALLAGCGESGPMTPPLDGGEAPASLSLVSFTMNEIQDVGGWSYAPSVTLSETGGASNAWVVKMVFHIPGFTDSWVVCGAAVVARGATTELFSGGGPDWRDWDVTFDDGGGARSNGGEASATLYFVDGANRLDSLAIHGPVAPAPTLVTPTRGTYRYAACV